MNVRRSGGTAGLIGIFGVGGFAREVMPLLRATVEADPRHRTTELCFVGKAPDVSVANGYRVLSEEEFFATECAERWFNIAIANSKLRERVARECIDRGAAPITIRAASSLEYDANQVGHGAILCAGTIITSNARIGSFFHANLNSYVAHDCVLGDFVTFGPGVHCNGNVRIGDHAYVGTGAIIRDGTPAEPLIIGEGATIGMGAVVTKSVAPFTTVVGNPARPLVR